MCQWKDSLLKSVFQSELELVEFVHQVQTVDSQANWMSERKDGNKNKKGDGDAGSRKRKGETDQATSKQFFKQSKPWKVFTVRYLLQYV